MTGMTGYAGAQQGRLLSIVLGCETVLQAKVRYVFDTLLLAGGIVPAYVEAAPASGPWLCYTTTPHATAQESARCLWVVHHPADWRLFDGRDDAHAAHDINGLRSVFPPVPTEPGDVPGVSFDIVASAFYFLSSWSERCGVRSGPPSRQLHADSVFARLNVPQDIVDRYLDRLLGRLQEICAAIGVAPWPRVRWPDARSFAVVLSHDVDFLPSGRFDNVKQGAKTILRHLVRQQDPADAWRAALGLVRAWVAGRDPYGCIPEIIAREQKLGVRSSFQVAVGHRHPNDVNYRIESSHVRDYLRTIVESGFDLCLHGSYRSTEDPAWYVEEVATLATHLARPLGSRQHFLSFDYDALFTAQERAGIAYDMSMGYPDRPGSRTGFSFPYFPYKLDEDRPYRVLQISLFLMDVTLRGYMGLRPAGARRAIGDCLAGLATSRGCASVVWHPIVFGGARDPGYDQLYFDMIDEVHRRGGLATDGRTINEHWRLAATAYSSFADR